MNYPELFLSICVGVGLAAAVGFRVFLPLLVLSIAAHYKVIPLQESWHWVGSFPALIVLSVATIVEIFAYFIPWIDNLLDTIAVPLAAIAGTLVVAATVSEMSPVFTWALAIIAGGGTATLIQSNTTAVRATSTATTAGVANPLVALAETGSSTIMSILAIVFPILGFVLVLLLIYLVFRFFKKFKKKKESTV